MHKFFLQENFWNHCLLHCYHLAVGRDELKPSLPNPAWNFSRWLFNLVLTVCNMADPCCCLRCILYEWQAVDYTGPNILFHSTYWGQFRMKIEDQNDDFRGKLKSILHSMGNIILGKFLSLVTLVILIILGVASDENFWCISSAISV